MTVRSVLKEKGSDVPTASPTTTVQEIINQFELDEVSALVVTNGSDEIVGIVSGGDILRAINKGGAAILNSPVSDIMTTDVFSCDVSEPISKVCELMDSNQIRHVPIVEEGKLRGVINTLDVVKHRLHELASEADALKEYVAG
jgi:CBS domain-containing protein